MLSDARCRHTANVSDSSTCQCRLHEVLAIQLHGNLNRGLVLDAQIEDGVSRFIDTHVLCSDIHVGPGSEPDHRRRRARRHGGNLGIIGIQDREPVSREALGELTLRHSYLTRIRHDTDVRGTDVQDDTDVRLSHLDQVANVPQPPHPHLQDEESSGFIGTEDREGYPHLGVEGARGCYHVPLEHV